MPLRPMRASMIFSTPAKAPPQMNRMFVVSIWMNSWWGCLRPPWGGTDGVVVGAGLDPLVVVVDGDGKDLLGVVLADHVVVQEVEDLPGLGQLVEAHLGGLRQLLLDDVVAQVDALVADVHAGAGDELLHLLLRLAAEAALHEIAAITELRHRLPPCYATPAACGTPASSRVVITSSMMPYSWDSSALIMKSRSVSFWILSISWPVSWASILFRRSRIRMISLACSSMSVA